MSAVLSAVAGGVGGGLLALAWLWNLRQTVELWTTQRTGRAIGTMVVRFTVLTAVLVGAARTGPVALVSLAAGFGLVRFFAVRRVAGRVS